MPHAQRLRPVKVHRLRAPQLDVPRNEEGSRGGYDVFYQFRVGYLCVGRTRTEVVGWPIRIKTVNPIKLQPIANH